MPATETRVHENSNRMTVKHTIVFGNMTLEDSQFDEFVLLWCYFLMIFLFVFCFCFGSFKGLLSLVF